MCSIDLEQATTACLNKVSRSVFAFCSYLCFVTYLLTYDSKAGIILTLERNENHQM